MYSIVNVAVCVDDLRINVWNFERASESFNIIDIKPSNLEELTEVITSSSFHPTSCNQLIYSTSRASIRMCDLRENALCDTHTRSYEIEEGNEHNVKQLACALESTA